MDMRCRITSGGGDPRESATENADRRGRNPAARVKRCGKSAPRLRRRRRHGKPHREQDRIGAARGKSPRIDVRIGRPGRLLKTPGNRRPRGMAVTREVRCLLCAVQNPAYRPAGVIRGARRETAGRPTNLGNYILDKYQVLGLRAF
jgi:hypothetical protein